MPQTPKSLLSYSRRFRDLPDPDDELSAGTSSFTPEALQLLLACSRQITLGLAHALSKWWRRGDPVPAGFAERMMIRVELENVRSIAEIQRARLARFPARQRKHYTPKDKRYTPKERFRVVELMISHGLSQEETADMFLVDAQSARPGHQTARKAAALRQRPGISVHRDDLQ